MMSTCGSARRAGTIRPARAPGTAFSTLRPPKGRRGEGRRQTQVRRACVLRRTLRHRRGQHHLLRAAESGCRADLGRPDTRRVRVLAEAISGRSLTPIYRACRRSTWKPSTNTGGESNRSQRPGRLGRCSRSFLRASSRHQSRRAISIALLQRFRDYPIAVELRHRSWSDDFSSTLSLLNSHNAALTQIDEPKFKVSIRQNQLPNISGLLLHAPARTKRRAMVEARQVRRPIQLSVFRRRAEAVRRTPPTPRAGWSGSSICISTTTSPRKPWSTRS